MLARLQQLITATLLAVTIAAAVLGATSGPTWLAPAFVALVLIGYGGVLAIEFFAVNGQLLANEMAPRVHNSGHWTIEGAETSQFENHLRAVLGLPLGDASAVGCSAMVNLIGTPPPVADVLRVPGAHLHLYGKGAPRPGRKMVHLTRLTTQVG